MKPQIEKPFEQVMKFFTPELFIRFNSTEDEEADRADEEWEAAILAYRKHLDGMRGQMPSYVKHLSDLCLHDAEILALGEPIEPLFPISPFGPFPFWAHLAILSIRQGDEIISLIYSLWDQVQKYHSTESWPFSKQGTHWLYDELDMSPNQHGKFFHRVLMSDGTVLEVPFVSVLIHRFPLEEGAGTNSSRQIA
jgi:hypothetical protein